MFLPCQRQEGFLMKGVKCKKAVGIRGRGEQWNTYVLVAKLGTNENEAASMVPEAMSARPRSGLYMPAGGARPVGLDSGSLSLS